MLARSTLSATAILVSLFGAPSVSAQELVSFQAHNKPGFYVRHQNQVAVMSSIENEDKLGRDDATFRLVPGLHDGQCNSLESVKLRGFYLRHQDFRLVLARSTGQELFANDATFCMVKGLADSHAVSFESVNFSGFYVRHFDFQLFLNKGENTSQFKQDATFERRPDLQTHAPSSKM
jgi:Alpha-L-arabinofuranosidase B (ABFB) domain